MAAAQRLLHEWYRGQRGGDQSSRSQSMARVVTVSAGALSWCFFCRTFLFPWQGLAQGCQQMIQVTLQCGLYQTWVWPAAVTFGQCSLGPRGERGACLPAELRVLPGPADSGRTMGALGLAWAVFGAVFQAVRLLFWLFGYMSPLGCLC